MIANPIIISKIPAPKTNKVGVKLAVTGAPLVVATGVGVEVGPRVGVGVGLA